MSETFRSTLRRFIHLTKENLFGAENYDELRYGPMAQTRGKKEYARLSLKSLKTKIAKSKFYLLAKYGKRLESLYKILPEQDKQLLVQLIGYRLLGASRVKLPRNSDQIINKRRLVEEMLTENDSYDPGFMHFLLYRFDLNKIGFNIRMYYTKNGVLTNFIFEQYCYKQNGQKVVFVEGGDVVMDVGGCWGDTALYFAHEAGADGLVYSFEFIPNNIKVHQMNQGLNPDLKKRIHLVPHPVSNQSGTEIFFKDNGPGSQIKMNSFEGQTGSTTTVSIDDFVLKNNIQKVDFIKMDIEGAEPLALLGAINTIKKFKPKLAIAIYHSMDDMVNIPLWIKNLGVGYHIYIDHFTIHSEETICFASVEE